MLRVRKGQRLPAESEKDKKQQSLRVEGLYNTAEWMITALTLTLVFIVFEMQAYTIPTGSMADTLRGAHFRLRCSECGYRYEYGFLPTKYGKARNTTVGENVPIRPSQPRCPSCGFYLKMDQWLPVMKGDRIFVLKCIYQFFKPERWDVVVFKDPHDPAARVFFHSSSPMAASPRKTAYRSIVGWSSLT